ncbi:MAG: [Fe-S]-binding protein, partial [Bacteroidetes bacterium HGW-Bacteroidetes-22]
MNEISQAFTRDAEKKAFDKDHRRKLSNNIAKYNQAVKKGLLQFSNLDLARTRAASIKYRVINDLDKYLIEFE